MSNSKTVVNIEISGDKFHVEKLRGDPEGLLYIIMFLVKKISFDTGLKYSMITDSIKEDLNKKNIEFTKIDGDLN